MHSPLRGIPPRSSPRAPRPPRMAPRGNPLCPIGSPRPPKAPRARAPAGRPKRAWMLLLPSRCFRLFWKKGGLEGGERQQGQARVGNATPRCELPYITYKADICIVSGIAGWVGGEPKSHGWLLPQERLSSGNLSSVAEW